MNRFQTVLTSVIVFVVAVILLSLNASFDALGFADAGEFALVTKILTIAHPPGTPSYVFTAWFFGKIFSLFNSSHIANMVVFSILCGAASGVLLHISVAKIFRHAFPEFASLHVQLCGIFTALSYMVGVTFWYWAHAVEVYSFHNMAFGMLLLGLTAFHFERKKWQLILAAVGLGLGLSNHHLTVVLFMPFIPVFFAKNIFTAAPVISSGKKSQKLKPSFFETIVSHKKDFMMMAGITTAVMLFFYGMMVLRAQADLPFKFGSPDNLDRLIYHLSGGAWAKNTAQQVEGIISMRFPYFMQLTWEQLMGATFIIAAGVFFALQNKLRLILLPTLIYYLIVLFYQLRIDQTADTDSYMILPFYALYLLAPFGILLFTKYFKHAWTTLPIIFVVSTAMNFSKADSRDYNVSANIMKTLDASTPEGSVVIVADWTTVSQYYYYRIGENFRTDLVLLNYDLKFTHYRILPLMYPEMYEFVQKEYDEFIRLLKKYHPHQAYNTGCSLDNMELNNAYRALTFKIQKYAQSKNVPFMADPKTFVFYLRDNLMSSGSHVSGMFVSDKPTGLAKDFLNLDYQWLRSKRLLRDPAAADKLVDLEAMLDFHRNYYRSLGDQESLQKAEASHQRVKHLQKEMKSNMQFLFRAK